MILCFNIRFITTTFVFYNTHTDRYLFLTRKKYNTSTFSPLIPSTFAILSTMECVLQFLFCLTPIYIDTTGLPSRPRCPTKTLFRPVICECQLDPHNLSLEADDIRDFVRVAHPIVCISVHIISPPVQAQPAVLRQLQTEEDDQSADNSARVQSS